jgi:uncharacterized protein YgiM (DUF1202 family)
MSKSRMRIIEVMASVGIVLVLASARTQAAPTSAPDLSAATAASNAPSAAPSTKPIKKRFLLSRSSRVYQRPDAGSIVVAHVKAKSHVTVIGITGDWLQIKLSSGKVGFIPTQAAE